MIFEDDINSLESKKIDLEIQLNNLLKSDNKELDNNKKSDKINELRSEILYLKKQIDKKLGYKEKEKLKEIKRKKSGVDEKNIKNYKAFKARYKKINNMEVATKNILKTIEAYLIGLKQEEHSAVKVMSR